MSEYPGDLPVNSWEKLPQMPSTQFLRRLQSLPRILKRTGGLVVTRHGQPDAVVILADDYVRLVSLIRANESTEN